MLIQSSHESQNALPQFAVIKKIIVENDDAFSLIICSLKTICFNEHFHSFEVALTSNKTVISTNDLGECEPLWILKNFDPFSEASFVSPRHIV